MTPESIHREMLDRLPELGPLFRFDDVLREFASFTWEQYHSGNREIVRHSFDYVEWLLGVTDDEFAGLVVRMFFKEAAFTADVAGWVGPRTRAQLRATDWAPPHLL